MVETLKEFISKKIELLKMEATEKGIIVLAFVILSIFFILAFLVFILLLNIGLGLLLGEYIGNYGFGMLIVAAFYLIIALLSLAFKKSFKKAVGNFLLKFINS